MIVVLYPTAVAKPKRLFLRTTLRIRNWTPNQSSRARDAGPEGCSASRQGCPNSTLASAHCRPPSCKINCCRVKQFRNLVFSFSANQCGTVLNKAPGSRSAAPHGEVALTLLLLPALYLSSSISSRTIGSGPRTTTTYNQFGFYYQAAVPPRMAYFVCTPYAPQQR